MIRLTDIHKVFKQGTLDEVVALNHVNLSIVKGQFVVLIGANGSGKTTLLDIISGNIFPSGGTVFFGGQDVTAIPDYRRSKWVARVFQNPLGGTAPELSVLDNFRLAALRTKKKRLLIGINESFKNEVKDKISILGMGLENKINQPMGTLSGGQRQALTLLMSIMDHTDILLLDEPTAALDPHSSEIVLETTNRITKAYNLTAILITHNLRNALQYGDRLVQMVNGDIARDLNAQEKQTLKLEQLYSWFV